MLRLKVATAEVTWAPVMVEVVVVMEDREEVLVAREEAWEQASIQTLGRSNSTASPHATGRPRRSDQSSGTQSGPAGDSASRSLLHSDQENASQDRQTRCRQCR